MVDSKFLLRLNVIHFVLTNIMNGEYWKQSSHTLGGRKHQMERNWMAYIDDLPKQIFSKSNLFN